MSPADVVTGPLVAQPLRRLGSWIAERATKRVMRLAAIAFFSLVVVVTTAAALVRPEFNWDMGPYIAVSLEDRISDPVELHRQAWAGIEEAASADQWHQLSAGNLYNLDQWQHPDHFFSQLPMYRVKIGYTHLIRFLDHFVSTTLAATLISAGSALALGCLVLYWAVRRDFAEGLFVLAPLMMLAGYLAMALLATPDLLMSVFGIAGIYLVVHGRPWTSIPFLMAMYFVRPDGIIFLFALLVAAVAFGYARLPTLVAFLLGVAFYGPIADGADHPGWWPHFYFSNIALQNDMTGFAPAFSIVDYVRGVVRGFNVGLRLNNWFMILGLLFLGWIMLVRAGRGPGERGTMMLTALTLCFVGKFATFPLPDDRVYFVFVVGFALVLVEAWKPSLASPRADARLSDPA